MSILVAGEGLVFQYHLIIRDPTAGVRCREATPASDIGQSAAVLAESVARGRHKAGDGNC